MKSLLVGIVLTSVTFIVPAHSSDLTGEALALACSANVPNLKRDRHTEEYAKFCNAYINGWDDARFVFLQGTTTYCPPRVTAKQLSVVFFDYLASHREARELPAAQALMLAFKDKWPCSHQGALPPAIAGPMYNTPDAEVRSIAKVIGKCDPKESYVTVSFNGHQQKTPIQCDYGLMMKLQNDNWIISFAYGNDSISFAGVFNSNDKTIDVHQFWPGPSPVEAVKEVTVNGLIDKNLESKCFHESRYLACGAKYQDGSNSFFYSLRINYQKLVDITEEVKKLRSRNYR